MKKTCYQKVELPSRIPGAILWWREVASGRVCKDTMYHMYHVVPPKGRKVPEGVDILTFPKQMLEGLLRFTYMTTVTVSNFGLEKFVASVLDVIVYFKLQRRKLYVFVTLNGRTYIATIVWSVNPASISRNSQGGKFSNINGWTYWLMFRNYQIIFVLQPNIAQKVCVNLVLLLESIL